MLCFFIRLFKKSCVTKTVLVFSSLALVLGLTLVALSGLIVANPFMQIDAKDFDLPVSMFISLIVFGIAGLFTGIVGICMAKRPGVKLIAFFALFSFFVSLAYIAIGAALIVFNIQAKQTIDDYCNGKDIDQFNNPLANIIGDADALTDLTNDYMCTSDCPCASSASKEYLTLSGRVWRTDNVVSTFKECYTLLR